MTSGIISQDNLPKPGDILRWRDQTVSTHAGKWMVLAPPEVLSSIVRIKCWRLHEGISSFANISILRGPSASGWRVEISIDS